MLFEILEVVHYIVQTKLMQEKNMLELQPSLLKGKFIELELLNVKHKDELYDIAQDESIWTYNASKAFGQDFNCWFDKATSLLSTRQHLPFIVKCLNTQKIIGSTRFYDIAAEHQRLAIGYTWFIPEVWGTHVNPESKLLLLSLAFENYLMNRVEFMTDVRNLRSQAAIKKLGATQEGLLRQHMVLKDGFVRDTVIFSIIKSDWEEIKNQLIKRLTFA